MGVVSASGVGAREGRMPLLPSRDNFNTVEGRVSPSGTDGGGGEGGGWRMQGRFKMLTQVLALFSSSGE